MFGIVYRFEVKPGRDEEFVREWVRVTENITEQRGGLGSRLHKLEEHVYFAYAQWPSREVWEQHQQKEGTDPETGRGLSDTVAEFKILASGEFVRDLLIKA